MELSIPVLLAVFYFLWVCVPMIPAVLIYALFPKSPIGVSGPLGALTISASGAFAAYIIVFGLAFPIVSKSEETLTSMLSPTWTVSAKVKLVNQSGSPASEQWLQGLMVQLRPDFYTTANQLVTIQVPEINHKFPRILLTIPKFGSQALDADDPSKTIRDEFHKTIDVKEPIEITAIADTVVGCVPNENRPC